MKCFPCFPSSSTPIGKGKCDSIDVITNVKCATKHVKAVTCANCTQTFGLNCIPGCKTLCDVKDVVSPFICPQCLPIRDSKDHKMDCKKCNAPYWLIWDMLAFCDFLASQLRKKVLTSQFKEDLEECADFLPFRLKRILRQLLKTLAHKMFDCHQSDYKYNWMKNMPQNTIFFIEDYLGKLGEKNLMTVTCQAQGTVMSAHMTCAFIAQPTQETYDWYEQHRPGFEFVGFMGDHDPSLDGSLIMLTFSNYSNDLTQDCYHQASCRSSVLKVQFCLIFVMINT